MIKKRLGKFACYNCLPRWTVSWLALKHMFRLMLSEEVPHSKGCWSALCHTKYMKYMKYMKLLSAQRSSESQTTPPLNRHKESNTQGIVQYRRYTHVVKIYRRCEMMQVCVRGSNKWWFLRVSAPAPHDNAKSCLGPESPVELFLLEATACQAYGNFINRGTVYLNLGFSHR